METRDFERASSAAYHFFLNDLCDVFIVSCFPTIRSWNAQLMIVGSNEAIVREQRPVGRTGLCSEHTLHVSRRRTQVASPIHALRHRGLVAATPPTSRGHLREYHDCFLPREGMCPVSYPSTHSLTDRSPSKISLKQQPTLT
jgi:hypothetical protein